ncbi:MAG: dehydrogenase [Chitinophagaceae bacterium]|nr:dehydrogenase [Chitinophagaceae bacterium]
MKIYFFGIVTLLAITIASCRHSHYTDPLTPEQALESFQLNDSFTIEIFATEPFVNDPVSLTFDDRGNAFVVEMPDYPFQSRPGRGNGQIRMLVDNDKDGRTDDAKIFADSLSEATSITPWDGGLIVTAAPDIFFMKDTNGDHRADIKQLMFTGFFKGNSEAQITALLFNIDNWIYAANNGQSGSVSSPNASDNKKLSITGSDFRFEANSMTFERASGSGQFGQTIDRWGNRFLTQNSLHIEQVVIESKYLNRHPFMPPVSTTHALSDHQELMDQVTPPPYWRQERTNRRNAAFREKNVDRVEYADKHFTGAAGGIVYGGDGFSETYRGNYFVGDVAGNLVHRDVLIPSDSSPVFIAVKPKNEMNREFLASTDPWFRPVNFCVGPDGYLYIVDMYRQHIEAPFAIPEDLRREMNFMNGSEFGRIYRVKPKNAGQAKPRTTNFTAMKTAELVDYLSHPNMPFRFQAQRILFERHDRSAIPPLVTLAAGNNAEGKVHALYSLKGMNALTFDLVKQALRDKHPAVRASATRLAEDFPESFPLLVELTNDSSIGVSYQACLSLGNFTSKQPLEPLAEVLIKKGYDRWFRFAVLSSETGISNQFIEELQKKGWFNGSNSNGSQAYLSDFARITVVKNNKSDLEHFLKIIAAKDFPESCRTSVLEGASKGLSDTSDSEYKKWVETMLEKLKP